MYDEGAEIMLLHNTTVAFVSGVVDRRVDQDVVKEILLLPSRIRRVNSNLTPNPTPKINK